MDLYDIPGFAEAVRHQRFVRECAFLGVADSICGYEVVPMTPKHWSILVLAESPLLNLSDSLPRPEQLAQFLWVLNPEFSACARKRAAFLRRCREFVLPPPPLFWATKRSYARLSSRWERLQEVTQEARRYVRDTFMDAPASKAKCGVQLEYFSTCAMLVDIFRREYDWPEEKTLGEPLAKLFQYSNTFRQRNGAVLFNPSDYVVMDWSAAQNKAQS